MTTRRILLAGQMLDDDCLVELVDPEDHRSGYPFIHCSPRCTPITRRPYDQANTAMARFPLCADRAVEYRDPLSRRVHAEPIAAFAH